MFKITPIIMSLRKDIRHFSKQWFSSSQCCHHSRILAKGKPTQEWLQIKVAQDARNYSKKAAELEYKRKRELARHESRYRKLLKLFNMIHNKPTKPTSDFLDFVIEERIAGITNSAMAHEKWLALPEREKQVYTNRYAERMIQYYQESESWEERMRSLGLNVFCVGHKRDAKIKRYMKLLEYFAEEERCHLLSEEDRRVARRFLNGKDLDVEVVKRKFVYKDSENKESPLTEDKSLECRVPTAQGKL